MSREDYYDKVIAPKLLEVGRLCEKKGMSMCAMVEYDEDQRAETVTVSKGASFAQRLATSAIQCRGNFDALFFAVKMHADAHGHSSVVLRAHESEVAK